ncbi:MAG TPA: sarcosine oxidase subunit gamma family protein [Paracoccaceae bacterium]
MPELIAKSALAGQAPLIFGGLSLAEGAATQITSVAALKGQEKPLAKALKALGLAFPAPNTFVQKADIRIVWTGRDQAFLIGAAPEGLAEHAALTDQSDGWACLTLQGPGADAALMRLIPLDLRLASFPKGRAARAPLNHMSAILMRTGPDSFEVMVFRSMARTAWHEIETVMRALAARAARTE